MADSLSLRRSGWFRPAMWLGVWLPIAAGTVLHYSTGHELMWAHNVLRRLYYLPIIYAAFRLGWPGGVVSAALVSAAYAPHAFLRLPFVHHDPAPTVVKVLEIVLYLAVGFLVGRLAEKLEQRRLQVEATLAERERLGEELVRAGRLSVLGEVVAGIAHEIKNPLHALKGTAEVVDPLVPHDAKERRFWDLHVSELERLERVAERFVSFANPQQPTFESIDLRQVAERAAALAIADARQHEIRIDTRVPSTAVEVRGDTDQLAQVVLNLCLNARRAIGEAAGTIRISVTANATAREHELCVENDGPDLDEADMERLFDPFYGRDKGGSGLGLSITARLVEAHGGRIIAENAGLGVRFRVLLPAS